MTTLPEDTLRETIRQELARAAARQLVEHLSPYMRARFPQVRATTESEDMTDRRETDSTFTTLLGGILHVAVKRYSDDTARVDVHTDRETNYARFPVSGAEAMRMIRSIRSGEPKEDDPEEDAPLVDETIQGECIKVYPTGEGGYGLSVEGDMVLHDVTGEQMAWMTRDLRFWLEGDKDRWTDGHHLFIEEDSDADICIYRLTDNGTRGEKITEGFCRSGFAEAVEMLDDRLSELRPKEDAPAEPLSHAAEDYRRDAREQSRDRSGRLSIETWLANPGEMPVEAGTLVDVQHRDGGVYRNVPAGTSWAEDWVLHNFEGDIIAWRRSELGANPGEDGSTPYAPNPGEKPAGVHSDTLVDVVLGNADTLRGQLARMWNWHFRDALPILGWRYAQGDKPSEERNTDDLPTEAHGLHVVDRDAAGRPMIEVPFSRLGGGLDNAGHRRWPLHEGLHRESDRDDHPILHLGRAGEWLRVHPIRDRVSVALTHTESPRDELHQCSDAMVEQLSDLGLSEDQDVWLRFVDQGASSEGTYPTDPPAGYRYVQHVPRVGERVTSVCEGDNDLIDRTVTRVEESVGEPTKVAIDGLTLNWFVWNEEHQRFQQGPCVIYLVQKDDPDPGPGRRYEAW